MITADDEAVAGEKWVIIPSSSTPCAKRNTSGPHKFKSGLKKSRSVSVSSTEVHLAKFTGNILNNWFCKISRWPS